MTDSHDPNAPCPPDCQGHPLSDKETQYVERVVVLQTAGVACLEALALALGWLTGITDDREANPAEAAILQRITTAADQMRATLT